MSIDTTKPWYPQDYPIEEVLKLNESNPTSFSMSETRDRTNQIKEDHRIRSGGPAGVLFDLRRHLRQALQGKQIHQMPQHDKEQRWKQSDENGCFTVNEERFMNTVDEVISLAAAKLDGSTIPETRFVISDYAVPVCSATELSEATRPCTGIVQKYWDMVSQEKAEHVDE